MPGTQLSDTLGLPGDASGDEDALGSGSDGEGDDEELTEVSSVGEGSCKGTDKTRITD